MKRLFLLILLLGLATVTVPPLRQRAEPHLNVFRVWLGDKLEGPMSPVLTPVRQIKGQSEIGQFISKMTSDRNRGTPPPRPNDFTNYLVGRRLSEDGLDPWGLPYVVQQRRDSLYVVSAGPDVDYGTEDDLRQGMRYAPPRTVRPMIRR